MKVVLKILTALAAIAGTVYVIATYGDKIVDWAKKILASCPCCNNTCECACEEPAAEEAVGEEQAVEEIIIEEHEPVANEEDFAE